MILRFSPFPREDREATFLMVGGRNLTNRGIFDPQTGLVA